MKKYLNQLTEKQKVSQGINSGIYIVTNPDREIYVGASENIHVRWVSHNKSTSLTALRDSIVKHGRDAHKVELLLALPSWTPQFIMKYFESKYIRKYIQEDKVVVLNRNKKGGKGREPKAVEQFKDGVLVTTWNSMYEAWVATTKQKNTKVSFGSMLLKEKEKAGILKPATFYEGDLLFFFLGFRARRL